MINPADNLYPVNLWRNRHNGETITRLDAYISKNDSPLGCFRPACNKFARRPHGVMAVAPNGQQIVWVFCSDEHAKEYQTFVERHGEGF